MRDSRLELIFLCDPDLVTGPPVYHLFPSHQDHTQLTTCSCGPTLSDMKETAPGVWMEIWWHWRKDDPDGV